MIIPPGMLYSIHSLVLCKTSYVFNGPKACIKPSGTSKAKDYGGSF